jgi:hypothetical protein
MKNLEDARVVARPGTVRYGTRDGDLAVPTALRRCTPPNDERATSEAATEPW